MSPACEWRDAESFKMRKVDFSPELCNTAAPSRKLGKNIHFNLYWKTFASGTVIKDSQEESKCADKLERIFVGSLLLEIK